MKRLLKNFWFDAVAAALLVAVAAAVVGVVK